MKFTVQHILYFIEKGKVKWYLFGVDANLISSKSKSAKK